MAIGARKRIIQDGLKFAGLGRRFLRLQDCGRLDPRSAAHGLGGAAERAQESAAHALSVGEASFHRDELGGMPALLYHQPRRLEPKVFDRLGRRLACLFSKRPAELTRAEMRSVGELLHRQLQPKIGSCVFQRPPDPVRLGLQIEKG